MIAQFSSQPVSYGQRPQSTRPGKHHSHEDKVSFDSRPSGDASGAQLRQAAIQQGRPMAPSDTPKEIGGELYRSFPGREGYAENFLGTPLPLPQLDASIANQAAPLLADPQQHELKYTHFSIIQSKERHTPLLTAVNIDGSQYEEHERDGKWAFDSRIDRKYQMGNEAYSNNSIDKGHMVRRRDPMWGAQAEQGQDDTFVYTNASLQHANLNQRNWLDLENHVLDSATSQHRKLTVFTGPVLRPDDPVFDNKGKLEPPTQMPTAFWKVMVWSEPDKGLCGEAYVMSQKDLIGHEPVSGEKAHITDFSPYRVPVHQLEEMTHLHFGPLNDSADKKAA